MASQVRCPAGHLWGLDEFDDEPLPLDSAARIACPYCGALCAIDADPAPALTHRPAEPASAAGPPRPEFPGYQVVGQLGRGGMAVVYKARQIHTDRLVAVKVPDGADLESTCRFGTEAKAAARAQSPNIVQVFEVGQQAGRPFLIMEYCPGGSLADRLDGTPLPARPAAALAETLARAVGAAHAAGVIHRDLKPANILLCPKAGTDPAAPFDPDRWVPKVTDFGLARRLDADLGQTQTGTILGTPTYMAPEQATGENRTVGPPADIYALGVILYELVTGRPPFAGTNPLEILEQIRTTDPVPPTRLQPYLPRDLETITLKCLHKDPARRYASAEALADDLARFLGGHPILARPTSHLEHWVKRARRNPAVAGLAAGLCVVVVGAAAYGVWYHLRLQAERDRARYHFQMSVRAAEGLLTEVAEEDLVLEPGAELKRKALLEKALAFYEELLRVEPDDPGLAWLAARGARRVGDIQRLLGRYAAAQVAYGRAIDRFGPLAARPPADTDPTREIADCHNFTGEVHRLRGDPAAADAAYRRALAIQVRLLEASPDHAGYLQDLSRTHYNLGIVARQTGTPAAAVAELTEAARLLDGVPAADVGRRHHRARIELNLGPALRLDGRLDEAAAACDRAIALYDALLATPPLRPDFEGERSAAFINRGLVRLSARDPTGAGADLTRAADRLAGLADKFPHVRQYRAHRAVAYNGLGVVAFDAGRAAEAAAASGKAADLWAALIAEQDADGYHGERGLALYTQGRALYESKPAEARRLLTDGLTELLRGLRGSPNDRTFRDTLRNQTRVLPGLLVWAGDHDGARTLARQVADALPDRVLATHRAVVLLAGCVANAPAAEADRHEALAIELVTRVGPADWSDLRADPDCAPLLARPGFAQAVGR